MNHDASSGDINRDIDDLINGYLDDGLTAEEQNALGEWIEADRANAQRFAKAVMLHDRLRGEMSSLLPEPESHEDPPTVGKNTRRQHDRRNGVGARRWYVLGASLAASVLLVLGILVWTSDDQPIAETTPADRSFATIAQLVDARWDQGEGFKKGDRLEPQTLSLTNGIVRLVCDDGVEVTLEGPAEYQLVAAGQTRLTSGTLTATVPAGAEGFRVETPTAEVTDLGTAFGIRLDDSGAASVSVFDGEVDVVCRDSNEKRSLKEGESIFVSTERNIEAVEFDATPFENLWPISSGIERSSGAFRLAPPWPRRLRFLRSDEQIFVVPEVYSTTLDQPLKVNISRPGKCALQRDLTPSEVPAGQRVRSFLLHFQPVTAQDRRNTRRVRGAITFEGKVLGAIVLHDELVASGPRFSHRPAGEFNIRRQLDLTGIRVGDIIELSEDQHTLSLDLASPNQSSDVVRVIVDASQNSRRVPRRKRKPRQGFK